MILKVDSGSKLLIGARVSILWNARGTRQNVRWASIFLLLFQKQVCQRSVLLTLHGTTVPPQNQADSYKHMVDGKFIFGLEKAWTLAPTRFSRFCISQHTCKTSRFPFIPIFSLFIQGTRH